MNKRYTIPGLAIGLVLMLAAAGLADVNPTPFSKWFFGQAYYNGQLAPVGSVIDAYDPDGIHCGTFTVGQNWDPGDTWDPVGVYGILHAYGDDTFGSDADSVDEGAESGELITFKLNHRDPQITILAGDLYWQDKAQAEVDFTVNDAIIALTMTESPSDLYVKPVEVAHATMSVRNDGNGLDIYTVEATSALGWGLIMPSGFTYAAAGETVEISFDISPPIFPGDDRVDEISFVVYSELDPTERAEGTFTVTYTADDVYAIDLVDPPDDKMGALDEVVQFTVGVRNSGNVADEYTIEVVSDLGWTVGTDVKGAAQAQPGELVYLSFEVTIPGNATDGEADMLSYTVTSSGDAGVMVDGVVMLTAQAPTAVGDDGAGLLPHSLQLAQNYPNPFNPTTTIAFNLPSRSRVNLDIIDVLGRTIDRVDLGVLPSGSHGVEYDGSALASGVYFYRLATDLGSETRKMILLK